MRSGRSERGGIGTCLDRSKPWGTVGEMKGEGRGVLHNLWVHWVPQDFQTGKVHILGVAFFAFYCD